MACHAIDADRAIAILRDHSQHRGQKVIDVAAAIVDSHVLLLRRMMDSTKSGES